MIKPLLHLNDQPLRSFEELKKTVKECEGAAFNFAMALKEIRDRELYLEEADSWDDWCEENIGKTAAAVRSIIYQQKNRKEIADRRKAAKDLKESVSCVEHVTTLIVKPTENKPNLQAMARKESDAFEMHPPAPPPRIVTLEVTNALKEAIRDVDRVLHASDTPPTAMKLLLDCISKLHKIERQLVQTDLPGMQRLLPGKDGRLARGSLEEVITQAKEIGLLEADGQWFYDKCEGCGWKNAGRPIMDFKATMRAWKLIHVFPSQKNDPGTVSPAILIIRQKELDSVEAAIRLIRHSYDSHQDYRAADSAKLKQLSARKGELKLILGIKI